MKTSSLLLVMYYRMMKVPKSFLCFFPICRCCTRYRVEQLYRTCGLIVDCSNCIFAHDVPITNSVFWSIFYEALILIILLKRFAKRFPVANESDIPITIGRGLNLSIIMKFSIFPKPKANPVWFNIYPMVQMPMVIEKN